MRASTVSIVILSALALALLAPAAQAAAPRTVASCDAARVDKAAGVARTLSDCGKVDISRGAERASRQALGRLSGALGVRRNTSDLSLLSATPTKGGPRTRFQQYVKGVPIRNGQVAVALDKSGSVLHVGSSASPATTLNTKATVSRSEALLTARRRVPAGDDTIAPPTTSLVAEPTARGGLELAWLVRLAVRKPRGNWNVVVSARSGEVLEAYDSITRVDGTALTYSPNPIQMTNNFALTDGGDADSAALTAARQTFTLTDLNPGINTLRGTFADMTPGVDPDCNLLTPQGQASNAARSYNYNRSQDAFEEASAYLAVTRVQRTYAALGFDPIFPGPVPVIAHCISIDNSFFSDTDGALHMGDGGVDDAEDSDVTVHELGHATQAAQVPGWGPGSNTEQRAMGEGFGDFLAAYIYLQDGNPTYQATRRFCVAEWDAVSYNAFSGPADGSGCLRWADGTNETNGADIGSYADVLPADREEHDDGRFWSATLTCVFNGLEPQIGTAQARNDMLTLVLAHHYDLTPTAAPTAFDDALAALRAEDDAIFDGEDIALINTCGQQRLGKTAPADSTPPVVNGAFTPAAPDGANGWYRTVPTVAWSTSDPESQAVDNGCDDGPVAANVPTTTLTCTSTSNGGTMSKSLTYKHDNIAPTLAPTLSAAPRVGDAVTATPNASDALSGVAAQACGVPDTSSVGPHSVTCTASDAAGNGATQTLAYTVAAKPKPPATTYKITKAKVARNGNLSFRIKASRSGRVRLSAKSGKVKFRSANKRLTGGKTHKVTLRLSLKNRAAFLKKLQGGKKVKVKLTITPTPSGKKKTVTLTVRRR